MSNTSKDLAEVLEAIAHQYGDTTEKHQIAGECRILASVLVEALQSHPGSAVSAWIRHRLRSSVRPDRRPTHEINHVSLSDELEDVRHLRKIARRHKGESSVLDQFRAELQAMRESGASWNDLVAWLRRYRRTRIHRSTLMRRMKHWRNDE